MVNPANTFKVQVDGSPLHDDLAALLVSAFVDDSLNLPDMFVLTFRDPQKVVFKDGTFDIGKLVTISVVSDAAPAGKKLISDAEVTAVEVEFDPGGTRSVVRGFDQTHRLFRGSHTEAYKNMSYADIARKVAQRNALAIGTIDATSVVHDLVSQVNSSDWRFLSGMAREVGFEVAASAGKLHFRKPATPSAAPPKGDLSTSDPLKLVLGDNLLRFRCSVSAAEQVKEVRVRSWNPATKQALIASAPARTSSVALAESPGQLAGRFGTPVHTAVGIPFATQDECEAAAEALAEEIGGSFASFDGTATGNLELRAGGAVSLALVGKPFDGRYKLTSTRHVYDPHEGYQTWFTVSGRQERSLGGLTSGVGSDNGSASGRTIAGVVPAIVTNAKDPQHLCRVKVKFPWLSDDYESDWVRTAQVSAGSGYGSVMVPEVGDEVLVAFEHGDVRRPYLIGGLYNGKDKPPSGEPATIDASSGRVNRRALVSRTGHTLSFAEKEGGTDGILLKTAGDKYVIELSKKDQKVTINADGSIEIEAKGGPGAVKITASGDLDLKAKKISMKADSGVEIDAGAGNLDVKGIQISAKGTAKLSMEAATVSVNGTGTAELKAGAALTLQGALVKIN